MEICLDEKHLIAIPEAEELLTVVAYQSRQEVIPCKPTSRSVTMQLLNDNYEVSRVSTIKSALLFELPVFVH